MTRQRLPNDRTGRVAQFRINAEEPIDITFHTGEYPDGRPGELFIDLDKSGSLLSGLLDALGVAVSLGLQHGVPLRAFVDKFSHTRFEPAGFVKGQENRGLHMAKSVIDAVFRLLGEMYVDKLDAPPQPWKRVILESPLAGDVDRNKIYARRAMHHCLTVGEAPMASHLLYTQVLDDTIPAERAMGIEAGLAWGLDAEKTVVYADYGVSRGMELGIERAKALGRPVEHRKIGPNPAVDVVPPTYTPRVSTAG